MYKSAAYQQGYYDAYVKYAGVGSFFKRIGGGIKRLGAKLVNLYKKVVLTKELGRGMLRYRNTFKDAPVLSAAQLEQLKQQVPIVLEKFMKEYDLQKFNRKF